jgi:hypothetical protein
MSQAVPQPFLRQTDDESEDTNSRTGRLGSNPRSECLLGDRLKAGQLFGGPLNEASFFVLQGRIDMGGQSSEGGYVLLEAWYRSRHVSVSPDEDVFLDRAPRCRGVSSEMVLVVNHPHLDIWFHRAKQLFDPGVARKGVG